MDEIQKTFRILKEQEKKLKELSEFFGIPENNVMKIALEKLYKEYKK